MLEATVDGMGSGSWQVTNDGYPLANLQFQGGANESGAIVFGNGHLTIRRENLTSGAWLLEQHYQGYGPMVVATAEKPSAMRSRFVLAMQGMPALELKRPSAFKPVFDVTQANHGVGTIRRARGLRPKLQAEIHPGIPPNLQLFALWTVALWVRRTQKSRAAARAGS